MVYFKAIRCKECCDVMHESCALNHWCSKMKGNTLVSNKPIKCKTNGNTKFQTSTTSPENSASCAQDDHENDENWRFMSLPDSPVPSIMHSGLADSDSHKHVMIKDPEQSKSGRSKSSLSTVSSSLSSSSTEAKTAKCCHHQHHGSTAISTLLRMAYWLSYKKRSKNSSSPSRKSHCCPDKTRSVKCHKKVDRCIEDVSSSSIYNRKLKHFFRGAQKKTAHNPVYPTVESIQRASCIGSSSPARYLTSSLVVPSIEERLGCENCANYVSPTKNPLAEQRFHFRLESIIRSEDTGKFGKHCALAKARTLSIETKKAVCERLCATWPQSTTVISNIDDFLPEKEDYDKCYNPERVQDVDWELNIEEAIKEWSIPYKDIEFKEILRTGQYGLIHKGQWHGEVLIYTFDNCQNENEKDNFWETIAQLCMIRHENIVLFMGACVEVPHLAVITSMRKGLTLFEHLHVKHQIISPPNRINIARQIAQAMGYLHAKGIIHKRLSSNNIILESKVKISLMDQGSATYGYNGADYGLISRGHLTYLSPQLMRCLQIEPPYVRFDGKYTPESDVYAFGTVMFELMTGKFPYHRYHSHSVIWLIGNGQHESVIHIKGSNVMRSLVASCWSPLAAQRPPFSHIVKQLQENISLNKEHSCSEPERLNKIGFC